MIRANNPSINASSMADIAFLLLIFFLVTTTIEQDIGIPAILPPPDDGTKSNWNKDLTLAIDLNATGKILINNEEREWNEIKSDVQFFYTNHGTQFKLISTSDCADALEIYDLNQKKKELWKWRLEAAKLNNGFYYELKKDATIAIQSSPSTSYAKYIELNDTIHSAVKDLRRRWCAENGILNYDKLQASDLKDRTIMRTLRLMYPIRIQDVEFQPNEASGF